MPHKANNTSCLIAVFIGIIFTSACRKTETKKDLRTNEVLIDKNSVSEELGTVHIDEARLVDIPLPLGITGVQYEKNQKAQGIDCRVSATFPEALFDSLCLFYEHEMELSGWCILKKWLSPGFCLLIFEKPQSICVISLNASLKQLLILTGLKDSLEILEIQDYI